MPAPTETEKLSKLSEEMTALRDQMKSTLEELKAEKNAVVQQGHDQKAETERLHKTMREQMAQNTFETKLQMEALQKQGGSK